MANKEKTQDKAPESTQLVKQQESASVRFTNMVMKEFSSGVGEIALTDFQKRLAQNYFIGLDMALNSAETKRLAKKKNQDPLPVNWNNVNMQKLARDVVAYARIGLDPAQKNHINMVPFKNNSINKYDIVFIEGYRGLEIKAVKYGLDVPDDVVVELIYATDHFKVIKKDARNKVESYEFDVVKPFERGPIIGGFYYHAFSQCPEKNKLVVFTLKDIEKRKPRYASVEFWGGEKDIWENGKVVGKEQVEGWYEKMCYKTIYRAAYSDITIDSQKIDEDYLRIKQLEQENMESLVEAEINENANKELIDIEGEFRVIDDFDSDKNEQQPISEPEGQVSVEGPGY